MGELLPCTCGSDDITVYEERFICLSKIAIITCRKCNRSVRCSSLKKAKFIWNNTRTPKERRADFTCKNCTEWDEDECECSHWYGFHEGDFCSHGTPKERGEG